MKNVMVFGATAAIAQAVIYKLAERNCNLYLFARSSESVQALTQDLHVCHPQIQIKIMSYDACHDCNTLLDKKMDAAFEAFGPIDLVFIAHGTLPDQQLCEENWGMAKESIQINALSVIEICHKATAKLLQQKRGMLAVITSVAGERGRQSNYFYGAAKGMLTIFLQGLRHRLYDKNIHVLTIMPGFVESKMTESFKKGFLWAKPTTVAYDIMDAIDKKKCVLYTPWFWRYIMLIVKFIPEKIFRKLKI